MPEPDMISVAERVRALAPMLADPDPRVRKSAVVALGRMACPEAAQALCQRLSDPVEGVRVLACQALGRVADPASVPALLARVHDDSVEVRAGVLWALANVAAHGGLTDDARQALFSPVVVMAFDPDDGVRADAAAVLGSLRDRRATDALEVLLEDSCSRVRANACASLGLLDDDPGLDALVAVIENASEDPLVLISALDGLARRAERCEPRHGDARISRAVAAACSLASLPEEAGERPEDGPGVADVRATALWALGLMAPFAPEHEEATLEALSKALEGSDSWARRYAIEALVRVQSGRARGVLREWAERMEQGGMEAGAAPMDEETAGVLRRALEALGD